MAIIKEELKHDDFEATIIFFEHEPSEYSEPWNIINLEIDNFRDYTPKELQELGKWLIAQGKRISKEYKSNGADCEIQDPTETRPNHII